MTLQGFTFFTSTGDLNCSDVFFDQNNENVYILY
jgi:hypothetical protein